MILIFGPVGHFWREMGWPPCVPLKVWVIRTQPKRWPTGWTFWVTVISKSCLQNFQAWAWHFRSVPGSYDVFPLNLANIELWSSSYTNTRLYKSIYDIMILYQQNITCDWMFFSSFLLNNLLILAKKTISVSSHRSRLVAFQTARDHVASPDIF